MIKCHCGELMDARDYDAHCALRHPGFHRDSAERPKEIPEPKIKILDEDDTSDMD